MAIGNGAPDENDAPPANRYPISAEIIVTHRLARCCPMGEVS
jgi:hypothetical protein